MINRFIRFFFIVVLTLSEIVLVAQSTLSGGYYIRHFTDENGLPQNSINDLIFDDQGYLWLGSQVGLVRFSGTSFKLYYPDDKPAMESNVLLLGKNIKGQIYFQTDDHNLYCYAGNNSHRLSPVNTWDLRAPSLLNTRKQLFDFTHFLHPDEGGAETARRKTIFRDLFESRANFYVVDAAATYLQYRDSLYYYDNHLLHNLIRFPTGSSMYIAPDKRCFTFTRDSIVAVFRDGHPIRTGGIIGGDLQKDPDLHSMRRYRVFLSGETGHLLAGSRLYRLETDSSGNLSSRFLLDLGFIENIMSVAYNKDLDLLLVATGTDGFYSLRKSSFRNPGFPAALSAQLSQHLFGPMALVDGPDGQAVMTDKFIFNAGGELKMVDHSGGTWCKCLYIDKKEVFVWSANYELPRRMTKDMKEVRVYPPLDAHVVDYREDEAGRLYCLTKRSLWILEKDSFRCVLKSDRIPVKGLNETLCMVGPHRIFIANSSGMMDYDAGNGSIKDIPVFAGAHVRSLYRCRDGSVLAGTYGQGYFYYFQGRYYRMPLDKNGYLITAHCFLEDSRENIWIPCNKGLFRVPKADLDAWCLSGDNPVYYYYYGREDGLLTNEFNGGFNSSGLITKDDFVVLLSMKGMVCMHTDSLTADFPTGGMNISHLEVDGASEARNDSIALPPDYNSLLVEVSCPFLGSRNNLYMEYRLKGLDARWTEVPDDGIINLSRLASGHYSLQVRKVNGFGKDNYSYREWPITVNAHFYSAVWVRLVGGLIIILLIGSLVQLWLKLTEKRKEVRVKAEKLKGAVVSLEQTVEKLQTSEKALMRTSRLREKLISLVIHDLRSPLRFLTMLAGDLHDNQARLSAAEIKERTYWVKKGTHDIYHFSEDFLLWVTSQKDNFSITRSLFLLRPLLQEIFDFFRDQVAQKGNSMSCEAAEECAVYSDPHILITIIRNLVDNANKYTDRGSITIRAYENGNALIISVADTGQGMSQEQIDKFFLNHGVEQMQSGSQLGHKFIFDLTQRINGSVSIESKEGEGTTVKLTLPHHQAGMS